MVVMPNVVASCPANGALRYATGDKADFNSADNRCARGRCDLSQRLGLDGGIDHSSKINRCVAPDFAELRSPCVITRRALAMGESL